MAGREARREREEAHVEAPRQVVIPRRAGEPETDQTRRQVDEATRVVRDLSREGRALMEPAELRAEVDSRRGVLRRLRESGVPYLENRYSNEIDIIDGFLQRALTASQEGRTEEANALLRRATSMMRGLSEMYPAQIGIEIHGVPPGLPGGSQAYENLMDSAEVVILDFGTDREPNARNVLRAMRLLSDNALLLNMDDVVVRGVRGELISFVTTRGVGRGTTDEERTARPYTAEQAQADARQLDTIGREIAVLAAQIRRDRVERLTLWRDDLVARIAQMDQLDRMRTTLETLRQQIEGTLTRLRDDRRYAEVMESEVAALENRYLVATGRPPNPTEEQREQQLLDSATELRGTRRTIRENSAEWFGEQALQAIRRGERDVAALAIAMGILERSAAAARRRGRDYLGEERYAQMLDVIAGRQTLTPILASRHATEIDVASLSAEMDRILRERQVRGRGDSRARLQRVNDVVAEARRRVDRGDLDGARRLLDMNEQYMALMDEHRGRSWAFSEEMEAALDAEAGGQNAQRDFEDAFTRYQFSLQTAEFRRSVSDWGRGISAQKEVADTALARVDTLVQEGDFRGAQGILMRLLMYAESVELLGVRRRGRIESLHTRYAGSGMERALGAMVRGEATVDGRGVETTFMNSFTATQRGAVEAEAERIEQLATRSRWTVGRNTVDSALETARDRARAGDFEGAWRLIRYVREYYGQPTAAQAAGGGRPAVAARSEGWRYALLSRSEAGFAEGRRHLLDAIRMEADATTDERRRAAASIFSNGTRRLVETEGLMASYTQISRGFRGEIAFSGSTRAGHLLLGYDADRNPVEVSLSDIRGYEAANPRDPATRGGPTLEQLFSQAERAASAGDLRAYNRAVETIFGRWDEGSGRVSGGRLWLVAGRVLRVRTFTQARRQVESLGTFVRELPNWESYALPGDARRTRELREVVDSGDKVEIARTITRHGAERTTERAQLASPTRRALETRRQALLRRIDEEMYAAETGVTVAPTEEGRRLSVFDEYAGLLADVDRERRTSIAHAQMSEEIRLNTEYRRSIAGESGSNRDTAVAQLDRCGSLLEQAQREVVAGGGASTHAEAQGHFREAQRLYNEAMVARSEAMQAYWAENSVNFAQVSAAHRASIADRPDERFFPVLRVQRQTLEIEQYLGAHREIINDILFGSPRGDARAHGERMQRRLRGTVLIETSIFAIPSDASSQFLANYVPTQRNIRSSIYAAWSMEDRAMRMTDPEERAAMFARAQLEYDEAVSDIQDMQQEAERRRFAAKVAVMAIGIACAFIPVAGPYISAAIFIGMQVDSMVSEYRRDGSISGESWAMLGLTVATLGFAGAGTVVRTLATGARATGEALVVAGNVVRAEQMLAQAGRLALTSRVLTGTAITLGVGLSGYMEVSAYQMYQQAQRETDPIRREALMREAVLAAGMGLFPLVHMGGSLVYRGVATPRARTSAALSELVPARELARQAEMPLEARVRTPEGLFEFMRRLRSTDVEVRGVAERELATLPEVLRVGVTELATRGSLQGTRYMRLPSALESGEFTPIARAELEGALGRLAGPAPEGPPTGPRGGGGGGPRVTRPEIDTAGLGEAAGLRQFLADLLIPDGAPAHALNTRTAARAQLERMRTDPRTQPAAELIDNMIGNTERGIAGNAVFRDAVRSDTPFELLDRFTQRGLENASGQIGRMLRPQVVRAAVGMPEPVQEVAPPAQQAIETRPGVGGVVPTRAMAGEGPTGGGGRTGGPAQPVPGRVGPVEGAPAGGGARGGGARPAAPAEAQPPGQVINIEAQLQPAPPQPGRIVRGGRWVGGRIRGGAGRVQRWWRGERAMEDIGVLEESADALIMQGLDATLRTNPQHIVSAMRALYERAMAPQTRLVVRQQCIETLEGLYRHPEVQRALGEAAGAPGADPVFGRIMADIQRGADTAVALQEIPGRTPQARRQAYFDSLPELTAEQRALIVNTVEMSSVRGGQPPLAGTQAMLGIEFSAAQRVAATLAFERAGLIPQGAIVSEMASARVTALEALRSAETGGNPVVEAVRTGLERRVRANQGSDIDTALLEVLRSREVATAIEARYGRLARNRFEDAVREGSLSEVLPRISEGMRTAPEGGLALPESVARDIGAVSDFAGRLRASPEVSESMFTMGALGTRFAQIQQATRPRAGAAAVAGRPLDVSGRVRGVGRRIGRVLYYVEPTWGMRTLVGDAVGQARAAGGWRGWRAGLRSVGTTMTLWRLGATAAHTLVFIYGLRTPTETIPDIPPYWGIPQIRDWITGAPNLRRGRELANQLFPGMGIEEAQARFLATEGGEAFGRMLMVTPPRTRPDTIDDLHAMLTSEDRQETWIASARVNDALADGRTMTEELPRVNARLLLATSTGEGRAEARTELSASLLQMGINTDDVRTALRAQRERSLNRSLNEDEITALNRMEVPEMLQEFARLRGRRDLNIGDLITMRMRDWRERGIAVDIRRGVVETYFTDLGMSGDALASATAVFSRRENAGAFIFLWQSQRMGHIPVAYADDVAADMAAGDTLANLRQQSTTGNPRAIATRLRSLCRDMPAEYLARIDELRERAMDSSATAADRRRAGAELSDMLMWQLLRRRFMESGRNYFVEVPQADGSVRGIVRGSLMHRLDRRAWVVSDFRQPFGRILEQHRGNAQAMRAFNAFVIRDDEEIYGDPAALASRVALIGQSVRGVDGTERPFVDEVNRLLTGIGSTDAAVRANSERDLSSLLARVGVTYSALRTEMTRTSRSQADIDMVSTLALESARVEGIVGPAELLTATDRSMLGAEDGPALVRFVRTYSEASGGVLQWIRDNREGIVNLREILRYVSQNQFVTGGRRSSQEVVDFIERNVQTFRSEGNGWISSGYRTRAEQLASRRQRTAGAAAPAAVPARPPSTGPVFPELMEVNLQPAQQGSPAAAPARAVTAELTAEQQQQSDAFFRSEAGQPIAMMLDGLLGLMYEDTAGDGRTLRQLYGEPSRNEQGDTVAPEAARTAARRELFRILIAPAGSPLATLRQGWGVAVSRDGTRMNVTINMRSAPPNVRNRLHEFFEARAAEAAARTPAAPPQEEQR